MTTVDALIDRLRTAHGGEVGTDTVDTVKLGDPALAATGVVTTFLATQQVLERAVELGANLIVTHEPTFYGHRDELAWLEGDEVMEAKRRFVEDHGLVIWRFHDGMHAARPDLVTRALLERLELPTDGLGPDQILELDGMRLGELAARVRTRLPAPRIRVLGDPAMPVHRLALRPGAWGGVAQMEALRRADVVLVGEIAEWETPEYVRDATSLGIPKGAIVAGHQETEEPGMTALAARLAEALDVPVTHVPAGPPIT